MAAKESQEMRNALRLVAEGVPPRVAAETAGVWFTSLYAKLASRRRALARDAGDSEQMRNDPAAVAKTFTKEWK